MTQLAVTNDELSTILTQLYSTTASTEEVIILSTCNRIEIYCATHDLEALMNNFCSMKSLCPRKLKGCSYIYYGLDCARHLFNVACGLDSMVFGENTIVAQIKHALKVARNNNTLKNKLSNLFDMALSVEKEVRSTTDIDSVSTSLGGSLVQFILKNANYAALDNVLFVGAGVMMEQIVPHFYHERFTRKLIVNRTYHKALKLAKKIAGKALKLDKLAKVVNEYSLIIACCNSHQDLIDEQLLQDAITQKRPLLIIDLSMPMVVSESLRRFSNIVLITLNEIKQIVDIGVTKRKQGKKLAEQVIEKWLGKYQAKLKCRQLSPLIKALRANAEQIRAKTLEQAQQQIANGVDALEVLNQLSLQLMNKLLHNPTVKLSAINNLNNATTQPISANHKLNNAVATSNSKDNDSMKNDIDITCNDHDHNSNMLTNKVAHPCVKSYSEYELASLISYLYDLDNNKTCKIN